MAAMGAKAIFQIFSKRKNRDSNAIHAFMGSLQALGIAIYNMHGDMRELFGADFENQRIMLDTVVQNFSHLEKTALAEVRRVEANITEQQDRTEDRLNHIADVLADGQEMILLQDFARILSDADALIDEREVQNIPGKSAEIARQLGEWLKLGGRSALSVHTGARWLSRDAQAADYFPAITERLQNITEQSISDVLGFLALYAHYHLKINLADTAENSKALVEAVFNPNIWLAGVKRYVDLKKEFGSYIPDLEQALTTSILTAASQQKHFIKALQTTPAILEALFARYEGAINDLKSLSDTAFEAVKRELQKGIDIRRDIDFYINEYKDKKPKNLMVMGGLNIPEDKNFFRLVFKSTTVQLPNIDLQTAGIIYSPAVAERLAPFVLLEHLGLGSIGFKYSIQSRQCWKTKLYTDTILFEMVVNIPGTVAESTIFSITRSLTLSLIGRDNPLTLLANHRYGASNTPDTLVPAANMAELQAQARARLEAYFVEKRKEAIKRLNGEGPYAADFNKATAAIDANLHLLKAYCLAAGFQTEALQALYTPGQNFNAIRDSAQVLRHLQNYVNDANTSYNTPLPFSDISAHLTAIRTPLVERMNAPTANYFQDNTGIRDIDSQIPELEFIKQVDGLAPVDMSPSLKAEETVAARNSEYYKEGLKTGTEFALVFIIAALQKANYRDAATALCQMQPKKPPLQDAPIHPVLKQGLLQAISLKVIEFSKTLILAKQQDAALWLMTDIPAQIQDLLENERPLSLKALLAPEATAGVTEVVVNGRVNGVNEVNGIYGQENRNTLFNAPLAINNDDNVVVHVRDGALEIKIN
jgi:hypothetical protein